MFEQKPQLVEDALENLKKHQQELIKRIELVKKEALTSEEELDDAFAARQCLHELSANSSPNSDTTDVYRSDKSI